jgi:hypothetical protein
MKFFLGSVWLLLVPLCAQAEDLYHIRRFSEKEMTRTYASLLLDGCRYADKFWHDSATDPRIGYWGSGKSDEEGTRAITSMVLACGTVLKYGDHLSESDRQNYRTKATRAIRYVVSTHVSGSGKCTDGKAWGNGWQTAYWTGQFGFGAWLMWDDLDAGLRRDVERVITYEADRFLTIKPPGGIWADTKAEENGWNMTCIALADAMFPDHPHASAWHTNAIEYMINTHSTEADAQDDTIVDGRPVREWFSAANVQPDLTLENHNIFHPAYVACSSYFLTQAAMYYTYGHRLVPEATTHHLLDTWKMFQTIILPSGESAYPQGMDWELHGLTYINLYASLASLHKDALAARMESLSLQYARAWQQSHNGSFILAGSPFGFGRHAASAEQYSYAFLSHKIFGPPVKEISAAKAAAMVEGVWNCEFVEFIEHRTKDKFVSFSWKNRFMGQVIPIGPRHDGNPDFTVPITDGLVGSFDLKPARKPSLKVLDHVCTKKTDGFETTGLLLLDNNVLKQTLRVTSIGEKTVVYEDRVIAMTDVTVARELGVPVGIENDEITGGKRTLYYQDGETTMDWKNPRPAFSIPGSWANVDGRLGIVAVAGSGMSYQPAAKYTRQAVYQDILCGSFREGAKKFNKGDEVAHRVTILFLELSPKETSALAKTVKMDESQKVLRLKLPEGGEATVPLL